MPQRRLVIASMFLFGASLGWFAGVRSRMLSEELRPLPAPIPHHAPFLMPSLRLPDHGEEDGLDSWAVAVVASFPQPLDCAQYPGLGLTPILVSSVLEELDTRRCAGSVHMIVDEDEVRALQEGMGSAGWLVVSREGRVVFSSHETPSASTVREILGFLGVPPQVGSRVLLVADVDTRR